MEIHEFIALGIGVLVVLVLVIYESAVQNRLREALRGAEKQADFWYNEARMREVEINTMQQRIDSGVSHQVYIRDQKIEELELKLDEASAYYEDQLRKQEVKYKILEDLLNKNWPKAAKKGG